MQRGSSTYEQFHTHLLRPKPRTRKQKIADVFWDKRYGTCLTRTPTNWFAITLYYTAFVLGVFGILYISMLISSAVASRHGNRPEYVLGNSFIGSSPSLNYFPMKNSKNLLWVTSENETNSEYVDIISEIFDDYSEKNGAFDPTEYKACQEPPFGYNNYTPCIFLRMNRVIDWKPQPFGPRDKFPENMPNDLKKRAVKSKTPRIWISCEGTTERDRDHLRGSSFEFQGEPGFVVSGYPFKNRQNYLDPIVAVKVPSLKRYVLLSFTCTAWAKKLDSSKSKVEVICYFE